MKGSAIHISRRISFIVALAATAVLAVAAVAIGQAAPKTATLIATTSVKYKINQYAQDTSRFVPGTVTIKSGGTLTMKITGQQAPHTVSIVKPSQLPKTAQAIDACKICEKIAKDHQADPTTNAPPKKLVVDVGSTGLDQPGDSVFILPGKPVKTKISAKAGTTLSFVCALHPWMQGKIKVK